MSMDISKKGFYWGIEDNLAIYQEYQFTSLVVGQWTSLGWKVVFYFCTQSKYIQTKLYKPKYNISSTPFSLNSYNQSIY